MRMLISYEMFVDLLKRDHSYYVGNLANTGIKMYPSQQTFFFWMKVAFKQVRKTKRKDTNVHFFHIE